MRTPPIPGPWHYETTPQGNITVYATRNGDDDKIIIGISQFGPLEQREANARLICSLVNGAKDPLTDVARDAELLDSDKVALFVIHEKALVHRDFPQMPEDHIKDEVMMRLAREVIASRETVSA
jgi:hypothetical protein